MTKYTLGEYKGLPAILKERPRRVDHCCGSLIIRLWPRYDCSIICYSGSCTRIDTAPDLTQWKKIRDVDPAGGDNIMMIRRQLGRPLSYSDMSVMTYF